MKEVKDKKSKVKITIQKPKLEYHALLLSSDVFDFCPLNFDFAQLIEKIED